MKKTLIILVLLFSSSVVAGDDLTGNNILCIRDPNKLSNIAFNFFSPEKVKLFVSYTDKRILERNTSYDAELKKVTIYQTDITGYLTINRQTLELRRLKGNTMHRYGRCEVVKGGVSQLKNNLKNLMSKQLKSISDLNQF